ncbi:hypothetical protein GH5_06968 [Leishmania sp. Ghana 2012 LV757]|uniref:hypothetical protein n=1 Tax=Leishmania sp. Ghana 2012 LV757 TaxID=2803181 RepID=UPI001B675F3E|nr:hypothetical protein GH5_06968 [Leishmania sp. Ghana 2012 LV757]
MRSASPAAGVSATSVSQHVESKRSSTLQQQQEPLSSGGGGRRPMSSMPPGRKAGAGGGRRRPSSAALFEKGASCEVAYLYQQLQNALQQQSRLEVQRQQQLVQYRRQLRTLCDDNASLRNIIQAGESRRRDMEVAAAAGLVTLSEARAHANGSRNGPATVTEAEVEMISQRTNLARQRHNRVLHEVKVNQAALDAEVKAQESLAEQAQITLDPAALLMGANRPVYLRMMRLEQLIDKVLCKQRVVGVILANYRHHLGILSAEATQYDAQQTLLDKEYADRHRDHLQLLRLHDTARAAYATAVEALQNMQKSASRMRKTKEKALQRKRKEVDRDLVAAQQQERRAVDLQQQLEEETQMLEAAENTKAQLERQRINSRTALTLLQAASASREGDTAQSEGNSGGGGAGQSLPDTDERVAAYEVAFRDMMRVAKVNTLDALVDAYQEEAQQQCRLRNELNNGREARVALQQEVQQLRERVQQTKYCVGASSRLATGGTASTFVGTASSSLMERELQTFVREEKESLATHVNANEANQALLAEVVERVNQLAELIGEYRADVRVPTIRLTPALAKRSSTLPLHVSVLAQKLLALAADTVAAADLAPSPAVPTPAHDAAHGGGMHPQSNHSSSVAVVSSAQLVIPANNRRVSLAHEGASGGAGGRRPARRRGRAAADVAGISSAAARALLYRHGNTPGGAPWALANQQRRRSSAAAGAGFVAGQDEEEDVSLATVAALPPPGGRVLDIDESSTETSEFHSSSVGVSDVGSGPCGGGDGAGGDRGSPYHGSAAGRGRRRLLLKHSRHTTTAGAVGAHQANLPTRTRAGEDDQEDPLRREEVKSMSELIRARQKLKAEKDGRRS